MSRPLQTSTRRRLAPAVQVGLAALALLVSAVSAAPAPAAAATTDRYRVELAAWIPMSEITGPQPDNKCFGYLTTLAQYNGNDHVGYDGEYKALIAYEFTYGTSFADLSVTATYGPTRSWDGICDYSGHATRDGGVRATASGVQLWMDSKNPLVSLGPAIDATLDVSFRSRDEMVLTHKPDKFPSHGFRVYKNGVLIATAVDYDVSCVNVSGAVGVANVGRGLSTSATPIVHNVDLRVPGQNYFGPCGQTAPAKLSFPTYKAVPTPPPANQRPVPAFSSTRITGPGNQVRLDASGSTDPDGSIAQYQWTNSGRTLGYGKVVRASLGSAVTSAPVTLTVIDNSGANVALTKTLSLPNRVPRLNTVNPADGSVYPNIRPILSASATDDDGDALQYNYRFFGNGVDLSSGWVSRGWQLPANAINPGLPYSWTVSVRDARGATTSRTQTVRIASLPTAKRLVAMSTGAGYWQVASDGGVFSYGQAPFHGSLPGLGIRLNNVIGMARTPDDGGYWLVAADGGVFSFGNAGFYGSMGGQPLNAPVVAMTPTPTGRGYWLVAGDGGVFAFGDAGFYGSMGGRPLNAPMVAMSVTPTGRGYWLVGGDGGVFAFGDAPFYGSLGGQPLNAPVVDIQVTPAGAGYWLAAADGGVFAYGDARFFGSMAGQPLNGRVTSLAPTPTGGGYWLNACDGGIFTFGDAPFYGSNPVYGCRGT